MTSMDLNGPVPFWMFMDDSKALSFRSGFVLDVHTKISSGLQLCPNQEVS